ncbi:TPA: hypothetical protein ACY4R4_001331 [Clostridium perfringens]
MDFKRYFKLCFKASIAFIGLTILIMWGGVRVRYELLNTGFVESNIKQFISGYFTLAALIGTVLTLGYAWQSSREKNLVEVVTKNRADWVKEMKKLFSEYFTKYDELKDNKNIIISNTNSDEESTRKDRTLTEIRNEISLRLNPNDVIDNDILLMLDDLKDNLKKTDSSNLRIKAEIEIKLYLKCEWERIKFETKNGLEKYDFESKFKQIKLKHSKLIEEYNELIEDHDKVVKDSIGVKEFFKKYVFSCGSLPNTLKEGLGIGVGLVLIVFCVIATYFDFSINKFIAIVGGIITVYSFIDVLLGNAEERRKEELKKKIDENIYEKINRKVNRKINENLNRKKIKVTRKNRRIKINKKNR